MLVMAGNGEQEMGKQIRGCSGFTLVETMIAITVLMVAVLGTLSAQWHSGQLQETSRDTARASADLQSAMDTLLLLPADEIPSEFPAGTALAAWTDRSFAAQTITPSYPGVVGSVHPDPLVIRLDLVFQDRQGRTRRMELHTLKAR